MGQILVIDDHQNTRDALSKILSSKGLEPIAKESAEEALDSFASQEIDLIITDLKLPGISGMDLLKQIRKIDDHIPVILITAYATVATAVEAIKLGAYDYITKPFSVDEIEIKVDKALATRYLTAKNRSLQMENEYLREEARLHFSEMIGRSEPMQQIFELVKKVAPTNSPVLITGESGTGKELIARAVHYNSPRQDKPFVKVSCSTLAEGVLESELFGHEKGAFTGAHRRKPGRFEVAGEGTIFLDEIGDIPLSTQVKLLRVLQEKEFERVGGTETLRMKARLITATNHNLLEGIKDKTFREDLYYRLNVVGIEMPPLRDRKDDIPLLVQHFIENYRRETAKKIRGIDADALELLIHYPWPGNVRELENVIERAMVLAPGESITIGELPPNFAQEAVESDEQILSGKQRYAIKLQEHEKRLIETAYRENNENISQTAKALGLNRTTLRYKMEKYGLIG
ncbi:sigma-54-dependent transcriptional regulator [Candidatus Neomarinimicrobiota bacterium]